MKKLFLAGFVATVAMTALMYMAPIMGMPKMDIATMLGTMFLSSLGAAFWFGMMIHLVMGIVLFPVIYRLALQRGDRSGTAAGALFGLVLWAIANFMVMPMIGVIHPAVKGGMMPAPGFLMLHLGVMAPVGSLIGHLVYGALLGKLAGPKAAPLELQTA